MKSRVGRKGVVAGAISVVLVTVAYLALPIGAASGAQTIARFTMFPAASQIPCLASSPGKVPTANVLIQRLGQNDFLILSFTNVKPGVAFALFSLQKSNQDANGGPASGFPGLSWYQSEASSGQLTVIKTILVNQSFGLDFQAMLPPTSTFHLGMWFDDPNVSFNAGCEPGKTTPVVTPFNGEHHAGPLAFITRPGPSGLGPLCLDPDNTQPSGCNAAA